MSTALDALAAQRLIPVIRTADPEDAVATARACAAGGMEVVELTWTTPDLPAVLAALDGEPLTVGVGTIADAAAAEAAIGAGARFLVSYANPPALLPAARAAGIPAIPGALTPSEVLDRVQAGAPAVKLFPSHLLAPGYVKDLQAVLPGLRVMATGGLDLADAVRWLRAGALAAGLGSSLGTVAAVGFDGVRDRAAAALAARDAAVPG